MKFYIDTEEWYPVYQIVDDYDHVDDDLKTVIPPDKLAWIEATFSQFDEVQDYLITLRKETEDRRKAALDRGHL